MGKYGIVGVGETVRDSLGVGIDVDVEGFGEITVEEEEQCNYCLKLFKLSELVHHVDGCREINAETEVSS